MAIDPALKEKTEKYHSKAISEAADINVSSHPTSEDDLLKLKIDPKKVTIAGLDAYENLMQGAIAPASSNATFKSGQVGEPCEQLFAKHTWTCENKHAQSSVGPMEVQFKRPISLVSLNIDLCFETTDSDLLIKQLASVVQPSEEAKEVKAAVTDSAKAQEVIATEKADKQVPF